MALAIGIRQALLEAMPDISEDLIQRVLIRWCNRPAYFAALIAGANRHGLDGVQGTVTDEAAKLAAERLDTLKANAVERAKAKQTAIESNRLREAEAKQKKEQAEPPKAKQAKPPQVPHPATMPTPAPVAPPKPTGPVIVTKKRRILPPDGFPV